MEFGDYIQYLLALVFVLALIGLISVAVKRFGMPGAIGGRRTARIAVLEATPVDKRRRLLLIRRDNVEHLVMIGGTQDFVVENGIPHDPVNRYDPSPAAQTPEAYPKPETGPRQNRRLASSHADRIPPEPRLDMPRPAQSKRPQTRMPDSVLDDQGGRRMAPAHPEQSFREPFSAPRNGERKLADTMNRPAQPDRASYRAAPAASAAVGSVESESEAYENYGYENYDYQEQYIPDDPGHGTPSHQSGLHDASFESEIAEYEINEPASTPQTSAEQPETTDVMPGPSRTRQAGPISPGTSQPAPPQSRMAQPGVGQSRTAPSAAGGVTKGARPQEPAKPQEQQRSADQEQERQAASKRARTYSLTEKLQQTRQQIPGKQSQSSQRFEPTMQAPNDPSQRPSPAANDSGAKKPASKVLPASTSKPASDPHEGS